MNILRGTLLLNDVENYRVNSKEIDYVDTKRNKIVIPIKLIVRLYEGAKFDKERKGINWKDFCDSLFESGKKEKTE